MSLLDQLERAVDEGKILCNEILSSHTTFRIGGPADYFVMPASVVELRDVINICKKENVKYFILGNGSNVLFSDDGYRGVIIEIGKAFETITIKDTIVTAGAGVMLSKLANIVAEQSFSGLEFASGIPGTLGGAVVMNAGAYGGEMKDVITSVKVLDGDLVRTLPLEEMNFGYRTSIIQRKHYFVLEATFRLNKVVDKQVIYNTMKELNQKRRDKQPLEFGSAGSTFKRPEGNFAGTLIEQSGCKGYRVGDAMVSEKHAGFVVNVGQATAADVLAVIHHVQEVVQRKYDVTLEPEVRLIEP